MRRLSPALPSSRALAIVVGRRIQSYRQERGLEVRDLAAYLAIPVQWVRDYESGARLARTYTLYQLAAFFGIGFDALVGDDPGEEPLTDLILLKVFRRIQALGVEDRKAFSDVLESVTAYAARHRSITEEKG